MKARYVFQENSESPKTLRVSVTAQAYPEPTVIWTLNGKNVTQLGFKIEEYTRQDNLYDLYYVDSTISKNLTWEDAGVLKVSANQLKHGYTDHFENQEAIIDIQCEYIFFHAHYCHTQLNYKI